MLQAMRMIEKPGHLVAELSFSFYLIIKAINLK